MESIEFLAKAMATAAAKKEANGRPVPGNSIEWESWVKYTSGPIAALGVPDDDILDKVSSRMSMSRTQIYIIYQSVLDEIMMKSLGR